MSGETRARGRRPAAAESKDPVFDKGRRTRQRILAAAGWVFARKGFLGAKVADIAKRARVSHGSFYTYFDSKEDVFREVASAVIDDMYQSLDAVVEGQSAREVIRSANELFLRLYDEHSTMLGLIEQVATFDGEFREARLGLRRRLVTRVERALGHMAESGEADFGGLDQRVLAHALAGMTENFAYAWFILKEPFDDGTALATLEAVWARALRLQPAPEPIAGGADLRASASRL